jgi:hypothetical protein
MPLAQYLSFLPYLVVSKPWTTAQDAIDDFNTQWKIVFPVGYTFYITGWEGPSDPDDYAYMAIVDGVATWGAAFDTMPPVGTVVFIVDFDLDRDEWDRQ